MINSLRARLAYAQTWFTGLTTRERRLVGVAAAAVCAFLLFIVFFSFSTTAAATRKRTETKIAQLAQVQELAASYRQAEQARQNVERQLSQSDVQLISYLEDKGTNSGLDIRSMNPKADLPLGDGKIVEKSVEVTLTDVELDNLVAFLSEVERGPGVVKVTRLRLEPRRENEKITAWATIATYSMKK